MLSGAVVGLDRPVLCAAGGVYEAGVGLDQAVLCGGRGVIVGVEVEPVEDGFVELLAGFVGCGPVQLARPVEQFQGGA